MKAKFDPATKGVEAELDLEKVADKAIDVHERTWKEKFKAKMAMSELSHKHDMEKTEQKANIVSRAVGEIKDGVKSFKKTPEDFEREKNLRQEREEAWQEKFKLKNETKKEFMELKHKHNIENKEMDLKNNGYPQEFMDLIDDYEKLKEESERKLEELKEEHNLERKIREEKRKKELIILGACLLVFGLVLIVVSLINEKLVVYDGVSVIGLFVLIVDIIILMFRK